MKKIILAVAVLIVIAALVFTACGKKGESYEEGSTTEKTEVQTTAVPEYSTEESGEVFVTNKNGDHIPVTTNKNGEVDVYEDLVTKTVEQVKEEKQAIDNEAKQPETKAPSTKASSGGNEPSTKGAIIVGSEAPDDEEHAAIIDWT